MNRDWRELVPIDIEAETLTAIIQAVEATEDKLIFPVVTDVAKLKALGTGNRTVGRYIQTPLRVPHWLVRQQL